MSFAMSLPRTKRVKFYQPDGTECFQEDDRWALVKAVHSNQEQADKPDSEKEGNEEDRGRAGPSSSVPARPLEALEKLQMARGEVTMMVDLMDMLEAQQHIAVANVAPKEPSFEDVATARRLGLESAAVQLKDVSSRLGNGAAALRQHLQVEERFFGGVSQLAVDWLIKPAPEFNFSSGAAPFQVDLRLPGMQQSAEGVAVVDLVRNPDGNLQVVSKAGAACVGPEAAHAALLEWQQELLWTGLEAALHEEAKASSSSAASTTLVTEVLSSVQSSSSPDLQELKFLLLRSFLAGLAELQESGRQIKLLPHLNAWVRHRWFSKSLWGSLHTQASQFEAASDLKVRLEAIDIPGATRSAIKVTIGDRQLLFIATADSLEVRGADFGGSSRWAHAGLLSNVAQRDIGSILARLCSDSSMQT